MNRKLIPAAVGAGTLCVGIAAMALMLSAKSGPAQAGLEAAEKTIHVNALRARGERVPITITGYGEALAARIVEMSPEVSGRVVQIASNLDEGRLVDQGETLFVIDPEPFELRVRDAQATVAQGESGVKALELEYANEKARLGALRRATELAENKFERARQSLKEGIGSQAAVDDAERDLVATRNEEEQLERQVEVYPVRIEEARNSLNSAQEKLALVKRELEKTRVVAPFAGRVKKLNVESDQYVSAGVPAVVLADDSQLEIAVPLDSRDAREWLPFEPSVTPERASWFAPLDDVDCTIRWTEDPESGTWTGKLDRIERFDPETRTTTVVIRVLKDASANDGCRFPLVEGMFCEVEIPCRAMEDVVCVPQQAITFDNKVYRVVDGRLQTTSVTVARLQGDQALVSDGIREGDLIITTRLVNPLENTLCEVTEASPSDDE